MRHEFFDVAGNRRSSLDYSADRNQVFDNSEVNRIRNLLTIPGRVGNLVHFSRWQEDCISTFVVKRWLEEGVGNDWFIMHYPALSDVSTLQEFCVRLVQENRKVKRSASFRFYARRFKWPVSLLPDVMAGRRRLGLERTLQMCVALALSSEETDVLVNLCLMQANTPLVREYSNRRVESVRAQIKKEIASFSNQSAL